MTSNIDLVILHRGSSYHLSLAPDTTFSALQSQLEELTSVPPANQKLIFKGKRPLMQDDQTILDVGFKTGMKVQMLGATAEELGQLKQIETEHQRRERILRERMTKPQAKLRSTSAVSSLSALSTSEKYRFHHIAPLRHLPKPDTALDLLNRLADDPAIRHVMAKNSLEVGLLTELAPHEHPHLLGLNENAGQAIKLRLRTDDYEGFRLYRDVRRVLCHELTHNVWSEHDNNFKEMNSRLNREVAEFERASVAGAHRLGGAGDAYERSPSSELEAEAQSYVLGGVSVDSAPTMGDTPEDRRRRVLDATMRRLKQQEEEVEMSCGTAGPASNANADTSHKDKQ